ncbi:MAG: hypothetical protein WC048_09190, partial [Rhizobium sp.]
SSQSLKDFPERKPSSPAAPPPSFSERTYKSTRTNKSTNNFQKSEKLHNYLKTLTYFQFRNPQTKATATSPFNYTKMRLLGDYGTTCERDRKCEGRMGAEQSLPFLAYLWQTCP